MADQERPKINIDKENEARTKEISRMISEGGLGSDNYYNIKKHAPQQETKKREED